MSLDFGEFRVTSKPFASHFDNFFHSEYIGDYKLPVPVLKGKNVAKI